MGRTRAKSTIRAYVRCVASAAALTSTSVGILPDGGSNCVTTMKQRPHRIETTPHTGRQPCLLHTRPASQRCHPTRQRVQHRVCTSAGVNAKQRVPSGARPTAMHQTRKGHTQHARLTRRPRDGKAPMLWGMGRAPRQSKLSKHLAANSKRANHTVRLGNAAITHTHTTYCDRHCQ